MSKTPAFQINENHRRAASTALSLLDETLCRFEDWADGREAQSALYEEINSLSAKQRETILVQIKSMRAELRDTKKALRLEGRIQYAVTDIWSRCLSAKLMLEETGGKGLRRYGQIDSETAKYIDEKIVLFEKGLRNILDELQ